MNLDFVFLAVLGFFTVAEIISIFQTRHRHNELMDLQREKARISNKEAYLKGVADGKLLGLQIKQDQIKEENGF